MISMNDQAADLFGPLGCAVVPVRARLAPDRNEITSTAICGETDATSLKSRREPA
jgi:hypothetical protein